MSNPQNRKIKSNNYFFALGVLVLFAAGCVAFSFVEKGSFELAKQEILLRKIGHDILLNAGDSTSRVLPVHKIGENQYQIRFENEFTFQADSVVKIVNKSLSKDKLIKSYIVNVRNCSAFDIVFGYAMLGNEENNIVPCKGRIQPLGCYIIEIKFENSGMSGSQKGYLIGGIPLLAFVGLMATKSVKRRKQLQNINEIARIGDTIFNSKIRTLVYEGNSIELTSKENKLLLIFAKSLNEVIERARLQKEIWEDEGVIVGRSLDMFISKLRKKLEADASIQLTNIHGKGYKLEVKNYNRPVS